MHHSKVIHLSIHSLIHSFFQWIIHSFCLLADAFNCLHAWYLCIYWLYWLIFDRVIDSRGEKWERHGRNSGNLWTFVSWLLWVDLDICFTSSKFAASGSKLHQVHSFFHSFFHSCIHSCFQLFIHSFIVFLFLHLHVAHYFVSSKAKSSKFIIKWLVVEPF